MDLCGAIPDAEWDCLSNIFSTEELEFAQQFLTQFPDQYEDKDRNNPTLLSNPFPSLETGTSLVRVSESPFHSLYSLNAQEYLHYTPQGTNSCINGSSFYPSPNPFRPNNVKEAVSFMSTDIHIDNDDLRKVHGVPPEANAFSSRVLQPKRKFNLPKPQPDLGDTKSFPLENSKKPRVSRDVKKNQKLTPKGNGEKENSSEQSFGAYSSEDDSASQGLDGGTFSDAKAKASVAPNSNGKTRASRGSATDPQSLYARRRRERINERLKILQNLVPNGTKVDISTMLEEAVHYVKFLQLQIKLLSSDDLWMYAPIAYNGIDIGLDKKISPSS